MTTQQPIPVPPGFEFEWDDPAHESWFWLQDRLHQPDPVTPLSATLIAPGFSVGASAAISRLSMPVTGLEYTVLNGYPYFTAHPFMGTPEEMEARFGEMLRITMDIGATVLQDWRETFEPQVLAHCERILNHEYEAESTQELAAFVAGLYDVVVDIWDIHMRVNIPPLNAVFGFEDFLGEVLGEEAAAESRLLLQGFDNKSVETGRNLWDLSRWVREDESFAELVANASTENGVVRVGEHARTAEFDERWQAFLDVYGWRSDKFMELGHPSWREEQGSALTQLRGFVAKPDGEDPYTAHRQQAADRERLVAAMEAQLPEEARPQFHGMLPLAQQYVPIAEDHNFTIDQKAHTVLRYGVQQLGNRLASEGVLPDREDVFYLRLAEIQNLADGNIEGVKSADVPDRRALRTKQGSLTAPLELGTPPPADAPPDPLITKFFGYEPGSTSEGNVIRGAACSAGTIEGTAKVVLTLDQADKLEEGDILVCPMTMPAWTALFGIAGAVVADSGGVLSHCAIVAREYGLPCVAGTKVGTARIEDGMRIRVDGSAGTVEILS